jgi:lysophospholipase L1-like esterase
VLRFAIVPTRRKLAAAVLGLFVSSCGGHSPTQPSPPPTPPPEVFDVVAVVFYDENGNGTLDGAEGVRIGNVSVQIGAGTGRSEAVTGRVVVHGVPAGTFPVQASTLPPFFAQAASRPMATAPQPAGKDVLVPLTLPIDANKPNTYMGFGDSITVGDGSRDGTGYRQLLENQLKATLGGARVVNQGVEATNTDAGALRIPLSLTRTRPAYTLILYGTNDWNETACKASFACPTVDNLRRIVQSVKGASSLPVLATIIPGNPAYPQVPQQRNDWVHATDVEIRSLAREEGALLVDLEAAFLAQGDLTQLFSDHVHPNDRGYQIMAEEFFKAITEPQSTSSSIFDLPVAERFDFSPMAGTPSMHGRWSEPRQRELNGQEGPPRQPEERPRQ